jgi:hypothetical protein
MPRYQFALGASGEVRKAGTIDSESFAAAIEAINLNVPITVGDTLEIGVPGFPPARFEWLAGGEDTIPTWRPAPVATA